MSRRFLPVAGMLVSAFGLSACAAGPDFHMPAPPTQTAYTPEPVMAADAGSGQSVSAAIHPGPRWWEAFQSPALTGLVDEALRANSDLAAARASLKAARESWLAARGPLLPGVEADASSTRAKGSQFLSPVPDGQLFNYNLQTAQLSVGYALDLFGGNRRQLESARAQYLQQRFETEAARITLVTNVIAAALQEASLREQVSAQRRIVAIMARQLEITRHAQVVGQASGVDVAGQEGALAQAEGVLAPLERAWRQQQDLLAYLTGRTAAQGPVASVDLAGVGLPHALPLSLPADLVRQRPDVRAAAENLHAASAQVGVAMAARLPVINLMASAGGASANWGNVLSGANSLWSVGGGVSQPIIAGGALLHKERAARAQLDQAQELYRSAVLAAFQNVADTLYALQQDGAALDAAERAAGAAQVGFDLALRRHGQGEVAYGAVLAAEQSLCAARQGLAQARAQRLADTAALYQALGGGWWQAGDLPNP